uniref:Secreted protein n=1 Tax=Mesocestoides corti TaxID=53468 RepID=A0A5K3G0S7_MESCO
HARTTRQAPSIRVHHAGHAGHYILHLICVLRWLAAYLPRMPLDCRDTGLAEDSVAQYVCALRRRPWSLYILIPVVLFSRWSVSGRCGVNGKLVSGLALSPQRVIQCSRDTTQPESRHRLRDLAITPCCLPSTND